MQVSIGESVMKAIAVTALLLLPGAAGAALPADIASRILNAHNAARAEVRVAPMRWDAGLAADAEVWARHLAGLNRMEHWGTHGEPANHEGENLWMGTRQAFTVEQMVGSWANEKIALRRMRRWEDDFHAVGHYTQMVWRGSTAVGCAIVANASYDFLVCRYAPQGNIVGQNPF